MTAGHKNSTNLQVETLEDRLVLSARISGAGDLVIASTYRGDHAIVREEGGSYIVQQGTTAELREGTAYTATFAKKSIRTDRLYYYGNGGNDIFDASGTHSLRIIAEAGDGDDVLYGGDRYDLLHGGNGDDTIFGFGGNDYIFGEDGEDVLVGNGGNDWMDGGANDDHISGNGGFDTLVGYTGDDKLYGGDDDDLLYGHSGSDELHGGQGHDVGWAGMNGWHLTVKIVAGRWHWEWQKEVVNGQPGDFLDADIEEQHP